MTLMNLERSY